jgi:anti-sigma regulatory factor (Ser/Thr protein kinase)
VNYANKAPNVAPRDVEAQRNFTALSREQERSRTLHSGGELNMETPEGNSRRPWPGPRRRPAPGGTAGGTHATVLGSLTIPGRPELVATARAFVSQTLSSHRVGADYDAATLLTSEIVTNAIQHTKSGVDSGTVTIVVIRVPRGVLVEIIDDGSAGTPVVKGDLYAAEGHGLFLVQHLAAQWGYLGLSQGPGRHHGLVPPAGGPAAAGRRARGPAGRLAGRAPAGPPPSHPALGGGDIAHPA